MRLSDIPGQEIIKNELHQLMKTRKVPHAIYLYGPPGNAKLSLALWLSQALLCTSNNDDNCEECPCCNKVNKMIHADLHFLYPSYPKKADKSSFEDFIVDWRFAIQENNFLDIDEWMTTIGGESKVPNISANDCRRVIEKLGMRSFEGRSKILIIWMAQFLGTDGNRLLKLIEEPPDDTYIILVGNSLNDVLPTIRSRCLTIHVPPFSDQEMESYLIDIKKVSADTSKWISSIAEGNMSEAQALSQNTNEHIPALWTEWLRLCIRWTELSAVNWTEKFGRLSRQEQRTFFKYGLIFCRRLLRYKHIGAESDQTTDKVLKVMDQKLSMQELTSLIEQCNGYISQLERYANPSILMMQASIKLKYSLQSQPMSKYKMV